MPISSPINPEKPVAADTASRLLSALSRLPLGLLYPVAWLTYVLGYHVFRYQRSVILDNLLAAFPNREKQDIQRIAKRFYRLFCEFAVEAIRTPALTQAELESRVVLVDEHVLQPYIDAQQPILLVGAHQANWEWVLLACASRLPFPIDALYKPFGNSKIDDFFYRARARFGVTPIPAHQAVSRIIRQKRRMRGITLIADQYPERKEERFWATFFGRETPFAPGCEKIARMTGFPVIFTHRKRLARGHYQVRFSVLAEPPYEKQKNSVLERYVRELERSILDQPENWLWSYDRWRHGKPLYSGSISESQAAVVEPDTLGSR